MAIKTLQNNFTTPEQSKRLLGLGIPKDSSDCYLFKFRCEDVYTQWHIALFENKETYSWKTNLLSGSQYEYLPCWSVGRLMEIAHICSNSTLSCKEETNEIQKFKEEHKCETLIEAVIMCIADAVSIGSIDFSKLEEEK